MKIEFLYPFISTSIWGVSIVGAKIVGGYEFSPIEITFGRFALAGLIFLPVLIYGMIKKDNFFPREKRIWLNIIGLSLTGVVINNIIFYEGLSLTTASIGSLLVSLNPLMTMIFGVILLGEKMTKNKILSVALGILGVILIVGISENTGSLIGNLLILSAVTIWGLSFSFSKKISNDGVSSIAITGWSEIIGAVILLPLILSNNSLQKYTMMENEVIFWFLFMAILSSVFAYAIHYKAIEVFGAGKIAPSTNLIAFSGAFSAFILLGDTLDITAIIGLLLIVAGVLIVHKN